MKYIPRLIAGLYGLLLSGSLLAGAVIEVQQAWIREAPPTARVLAGYLTLVNTGDTPAEITAISSPDFARAELHETRVDDGIARMVPVDSIRVPAGGRVLLEPGGIHLMLFDPVQPLKLGDRVMLEVKLLNGSVLMTEARITMASGGSDEHHHDSH